MLFKKLQKKYLLSVRERTDYVNKKTDIQFTL